MKKNLLTFIFAALALALLAGSVNADLSINSTPEVTPSDETATVDWETNETSYNTTVYYGTTSSLGSTATSTTNDTTPSVTLTGLVDETTYYYVASSCGANGVCVNSSTSTFETLANCDGANVQVDCDTLEGLPNAGEDLGGFFTNLAPGLGFFILILGIFVGLGAIVAGIAVGLKTLFSRMKFGGK